MIGNKAVDDVSCDYQFMVPVIDRVEAARRKANYWVLPEQECYLVFGNTGKYSINEAIKIYHTNLQEKYNIKLIFLVIWSS